MCGIGFVRCITALVASCLTVVAGGGACTRLWRGDVGCVPCSTAVAGGGLCTLHCPRCVTVTHAGLGGLRSFIGVAKGTSDSQRALKRSTRTSVGAALPLVMWDAGWHLGGPNKYSPASVGRVRDAVMMAWGGQAGGRGLVPLAKGCQHAVGNNLPLRKPSLGAVDSGTPQWPCRPGLQGCKEEHRQSAQQSKRLITCSNAPRDVIIKENKL